MVPSDSIISTGTTVHPCSRKDNHGIFSAPYGFLNSEKMRQTPTSKTVYMHISEKNETKVMNGITFRASSKVNRYSITSVAMTTVTYQTGRKFTFNPIYFVNDFGDP